MDDFLHHVDWQRPWLAPLLPAATKILSAPDWRVALNETARERDIRNHRGRAIHFVPQSDLPPNIAYEAFISDTGGVPTRDNLHDFFNATVWLTFPKIKVRLNALQAEDISRSSSKVQLEDTPTGMRGKLRDGATIFDENAALFMCSDANLVAALRQHRWTELFLGRRDEFLRRCEVTLFGHALMEKLVQPYKAITAHSWVGQVDEAFFGWPPRAKQAWIDEAVANQLAGGFDTSNFSPLPVLGIPGWWPDQDQAFYEDASVFRPPRRARP